MGRLKGKRTCRTEYNEVGYGICEERSSSIPYIPASVKALDAKYNETMREALKHNGSGGEALTER